MSLSIDDFLAAAMLHPGATDFAIRKDKKSGQEFIEACSDVFEGTTIVCENSYSKKSAVPRKTLQKALKKRFGEKIANFACPPSDHHLDASTITHLIKIAESTDSKNRILRENCILSNDFMLSTEFIAQLRLAGDDHDAFYQSEYKKIIKDLDDYENEVGGLAVPQKLKRLAKLESKANLLLQKQKVLCAETTDVRHSKLQNQCQVTQQLLEGIEEEKKMTLCRVKNQ